MSDELARYAEFRGARKRLGRNWRLWPVRQRGGTPDDGDMDRDEERFHLVGQTEVVSPAVRSGGFS